MKSGLVAQVCDLSPQKGKQEDHKFKVILNYHEILSPKKPRKDSGQKQEAGAGVIVQSPGRQSEAWSLEKDHWLSQAGKREGGLEQRVLQAGRASCPPPRAGFYPTTLKPLARLPTSGDLEVNQTGAQLLPSAPRHIWFKFPGSNWSHGILA